MLQINATLERHRAYGLLRNDHGDEPTTTLTVAKLKALCVLNDLSASGKKAELLARLLEAGVDKETLGIEVYDEKTATFQPVAGGGRRCPA